MTNFENWKQNLKPEDLIIDNARMLTMLNFKPYGMQMPEREIFMATRPGLGGKENW